jgi:hypothetical protein
MKKMKQLLCLMALVLISSSAIAQFSIRPQVGVNFTSFSDELLDANWSSNVGYQLGLDVQIGNKVYFQPGLNYQVSRLTFEGAEEVQFSSSRLNIPVLVGLKLFEENSKAFGARLFAGPNIALHTSEDIDDALQELSSDDFNTAQFSGLVGGGLDIGILFVDLVYKFGLSKFIDTGDQDTRVNVFMLNAGIRLGR